MNIEQLLETIDLCNNGYIHNASREQYALAAQYPELVKRDRNCLKRVTTVIERYALPYKPVTFSQYPEPDYEGAILARQEQREIY